MKIEWNKKVVAYQAGKEVKIKKGRKKKITPFSMVWLRRLKKKE